jgi:hypothetical protein
MLLSVAAVFHALSSSASGSRNEFDATPSPATSYTACVRAGAAI